MSALHAPLPLEAGDFMDTSSHLEGMVPMRISRLGYRAILLLDGQIDSQVQSVLFLGGGARGDRGPARQFFMWVLTKNSPWNTRDNQCFECSKAHHGHLRGI